MLFQCCVWLNVYLQNTVTSNEPHRDKTSKWHVRPAKTQISLGIRPVWSESSLSAWRKLGSLVIHLSARQRLWSDWAVVGFVKMRLKCLAILYCIVLCIFCHLWCTTFWRTSMRITTTTPQWQDWCLPPNNHNPNLFNPVIEDFLPWTFTAYSPFSPDAAVTRADWGEESRTHLGIGLGYALWNHCVQTLTAKPTF